MFYSNALSVRLILLKIKKEARTMGLLREEKRARSIRRRREKEGVAGEYEGARKKDPINVKAPRRKKECPGGEGWSPARALC